MDDGLVATGDASGCVRLFAVDSDTGAITTPGASTAADTNANENAKPEDANAGSTVSTAVNLGAAVLSLRVVTREITITSRSPGTSSQSPNDSGLTTGQSDANGSSGTTGTVTKKIVVLAAGHSDGRISFLHISCAQAGSASCTSAVPAQANGNSGAPGPGPGPVLLRPIGSVQLPEGKIAQAIDEVPDHSGSGYGAQGLGLGLGRILLAAIGCSSTAFLVSLDISSLYN